MTRWVSLCGLLCLHCATAPAATAPPPGPPPGPAPAADPAPVVDGDVSDATIGGLRVLVKHIPNAEFVAGQLYIRGGVRNWDKDTAGAEQLALTVSATGGTASVPKDAFTTRMAAMGSNIGASAGNDFSMWSVKALKDQWDPTFTLFADAFLHPALPATEIELQRARQISALKHEQEYPDSQLGLTMHEMLFKGHPYENRSIGTMDSVKGLKVQQLQAALAKLRQRRRLVWIVAGDVDATHVLAQARAAFGDLPEGDYKASPLPSPHFDKARLVNVTRDLPTHYIEGVFLGPAWSDVDAVPGVVAMNVLRWRLWEEVRTKRNLSYAPAAGYNTTTEIPRGFLYVTAERPNETLEVMYREVHKLRNIPVPAQELAGHKSVFLTGFYEGNESVDGQARLLGSCLFYWGDWRVARSLPDRVKAVTAEDIQRFAQKYIGRLQTAVIGKAGGVDKDLFTSL